MTQKEAKKYFGTVNVIRSLQELGKFAEAKKLLGDLK